MHFLDLGIVHISLLNHNNMAILSHNMYNKLVQPALLAATAVIQPSGRGQADFKVFSVLAHDHAVSYLYFYTSISIPLFLFPLPPG